jgi:hypothetical protein
MPASLDFKENNFEIEIMTTKQVWNKTMRLAL